MISTKRNGPGRESVTGPIYVENRKNERDSLSVAFRKIVDYRVSDCN